MTPKTQQGEAPSPGAIKIAADKLAKLVAREGEFSDQTCAARAHLFGMIDALSAPSPSPAVREALAELVALIDNDAYAITFQTMGQYRSALLKAARSALSAPSVPPVEAPKPVAGFLKQIEAAKASFASWPQWMKDAAVTAVAALPAADTLGPGASAPVQEGREPVAYTSAYQLQAAKERREGWAGRPDYLYAYFDKSEKFDVPLYAGEQP